LGLQERPAPKHTHVARPSSEEDQVAALVALGTISSKSLWVVCGATAFNSKVAMAAHTTLMATADAAPPPALGVSALELAEAEVIAAGAKERHGDKDDHTMPGDDLAAVVRFVHLKDTTKGWSAHITKARRVAFLGYPRVRVGQAGSLRCRRRAPHRSSDCPLPLPLAAAAAAAAAPPPPLALAPTPAVDE
jgi:hypothetical protein